MMENGSEISYDLHDSIQSECGRNVNEMLSIEDIFCHPESTNKN